MNRGAKAALAAVMALALTAPGAGRAVEVKAGAWDLSFGGNVNAFATYQVCGTRNANVGGGLACGKATGAPDQFSIESGLLPSAFVFGAKTRVDDLETSATLGLYPGLHTSDTRTGAGGAQHEFSMDVRQLFLTVGSAKWGTVKLGKDIGLFGSDAILSDMTLLGVGAGAHQLANHNVTIGHIGTGYIYADWIPQVTYISPTSGGLQLTVSVVEGFGPTALGTTTVANPTPGFQARVSYDVAGPVSARIWVGGMYQRAKGVADPHPTLDTWAGEAGVKLNLSGLGLLGYGYVGDGVGTILMGLLATPFTTSGSTYQTRKSSGYFGQATYAIPGTKLKPGVSYGVSTLDTAKGETAPELVDTNSMLTVALFYSLTPNLTLTAEYDHLSSKNHAGYTAMSSSGALGGIIFF
jgi:predicted porin